MICPLVFLICSSFTSCLSIPVQVHPESTSTLSYNFLLFDVFTFVYTLSFFFVVSSLQNNILILQKFTMYRGLLYHAYSKSLTKPSSLSLFSLSSSFKFSCTLLFFIFCPDLQFFYKIYYFIILIILSGFLFFLWFSTILCYIFVDIAVKVSKLSIFVIVVFRLFNIYKYFFSSIDNS